MNNTEWEERYNEAIQRADFFEPNTLVIPINDAILLTRMLLTESIAQAGQEGYKRGVKAVELPTYDHLKCPIRETCIGYQNAWSDLQNVKDVLLASLDTTIKEKNPTTLR